jgi:hypothetical protein
MGDFGHTYVAEDSWLSGTPQCVVKFFQPKVTILNDGKFVSVDSLAMQKRSENWVPMTSFRNS